MSNPPDDLLALRARFADETGCALADVGIAADVRHLLSGGYHCGSEDLKSLGARDDYSIRQPRDRAYYDFELAHGSNFSSAMDFPDDWPRGGRAAWIRWNNLMRRQLGVNDPALAAIRGMNYSPDGTSKRRFDCLTDVESSSSDTVTWHTHVEWWRDTIGADQRRWAATRIIAMVVAARDNTPLDVTTKTSPKGNDTMLVQVSGGDGKVWLTGPTPLWIDRPEWRDQLIPATGPVVALTQARFDAVMASQRTSLVDPAAVAAALAGNEAFITAVANAVGAAVKDQFGPAFDARVTAAARAAVDARLDDDATT